MVIAAPTNYDPVKNYFDTSHVEEVIDLVLEVNPAAVMVIKSTIPVGYTRSLYLRYAQRGVQKFNLLFSPEFCARARRSMTIFTPVASLWDILNLSTNPSLRLRIVPLSR